MYNCLPYESRENICSFLAPPDVYNLCRADPKCFLLSHLDDTRHRGEEMLHQTLMNGLRRNLQSYDGEFLNSFISISRGLPVGSVALGGSIVVQTVLGELWPSNTTPYGNNYITTKTLNTLRRIRQSNIAIYCNAEVATYVRSWLVASFDLVLVGLVGSPQDQQRRANSRNVEFYTKAPANGDVFQMNDSLWEFQRDHSIINSIDINGATLRISTNTGVSEFERDPPTINSIIDGDTLHISTYTGVPLIWEGRLVDQRTHGRFSVDLIVSHPGRPCMDVTNDFEMNICRCLFNGHTFLIPSPNNTFRRRTDINTRLNPSMAFYIEIALAYITAVARGCNITMANLLKEQNRLSFLFRKLDLEIPAHQRVGTLFSPDYDACVWSVRVKTGVWRTRSVVIKTALQSREMHVASGLYRRYGHRPLFMHNVIIGLLFSRIVEYISQGIVLADLPREAINPTNRSILLDIIRILPREDNAWDGIDG